MNIVTTKEDISCSTTDKTGLSTISNNANETNDSDHKATRPIFPFFIPPFRGLYNPAHPLSTSGQVDALALRSSGLVPAYSGKLLNSTDPMLTTFKSLNI